MTVEEEGNRGRGLTCDAVEHVGGGLALGEPEEEPAEPLPRLLDHLHPLLHLEVAEILLPDPALLPHPEDPLLGERPPDLPQRRPRPLVRRHIEVHLIVGGAPALRHGLADAPPGRAGLLGPERREGDPVVRRGGVGRHVQVALALAVPYEDDPLRKPPLELRMPSAHLLHKVEVLFFCSHHPKAQKII